MKTWLAQQCRWPPALPVFPANREFYREICKIRGFGTPETANNDGATGLLTQIAYSTEQGIILSEQGYLKREQGILSAEIKIITERNFRNKELLDDVRCYPESGH